MHCAARTTQVWLLLAALSPLVLGAEVSNDGECFSTVQVAHPRAGLVAPSQPHKSGLAGGEGDGKPKKDKKDKKGKGGKKSLKDREDEDEAKMVKEISSEGPQPDLQGLALHFKVLYAKVAELEARVEQLEEARDEQAELIESQAKVIEKQATLLQAQAPGHAAPPKQRKATSEERSAAVRRGQQRALGELLRESQAGRAKSGLIWPSCSDPESNVGVDKDGVSLDFGRYSCSMEYDLGWYGSGETQLFDLDLNFGQKQYPAWLRKMNVFSHLGDKMRSLFPALPELASTFFDELCDVVVGHLSSPPATSLLLTDNKHSSVHVWTRSVSALEASRRAAGESTSQSSRPHETIIDEPDKCLFFKKSGEREGTDFWAMQSFFGPCEDISDLSPDVSLGIQSKIPKWRPEQCFNHTQNFNLPIAAAAGAGVVFDILPPTITTNFWGCFADFMQIVQGKGSMAVFGLEVKAFGLEVVDTQVPIENPIKKFDCYVAGVQEGAQAHAAGNSSRAARKRATARLQEVEVDLRSKRVSRKRRLEGEAGAKALARAMRRRPASLAETGAADRSDAEAGAQQVFELRLGDRAQPLQPLACGAPACASYYHRIGGAAVSDLTASPKFPDAPDEQVALGGQFFQLPANSADRYGALMEGFVVAPDSGAYSFITESDNSSEVWVSSSPNAKDADMVKVVELQGCCKRVDGTTQVQWEKGQAYYVKVLFKEGVGGDMLKVGMNAPDGSEHFPLPLDMLYRPPPGTEQKNGLTVIDTDTIGLVLQGKIRGGKLSVGLDLRVGDLVDLSDEFELLDFHELIKGGMSILGCVNPCFADIAVKAWEEHIEGVV